MADNYSINTFTGDIQKWINSVTSGLEDVVRDFVKAVHSDLVNRSPVDTGRFKANWQITYNHIPLYALNEYDKEGSKTIAGGARVTNALPLGRGGAVTTIYFSNMLIYANALEYGHSQQAPAGVLGLVAIRLKSYISDAIIESRRKNGL